MLLLTVCMVAGFLFTLLGLAVAIFRLACHWCNLERPSVLATVGILFLSWAVWAVAETGLILVLQHIYETLAFPPWEANIVGFFLGLPFHMVVMAFIHVVLLRVSIGKAIEVWFIQQMILFAIVLAMIGMLAIGYLAAGNQ